MVPKELRLFMRHNDEINSELKLTAVQRYFADINQLAVSNAGGRFPTSGEYLTAVARLYGLCTNLHEALQQAKDTESGLQIVRSSSLPIGIIQEISTAIVKTDELQNRQVQIYVLNACLSFVEDFELGTIGLTIQNEPAVQSWEEILLKAATCPNIVVRTSTEIRLHDTLEAITKFLASETTGVGSSPETIIDHEDLASHQSREIHLRFLERIGLDVYQPAEHTLIHVYNLTALRTRKVIYQLFPRTGCMVYVSTDLKSRSAKIMFTREHLDTVISRLHENGFVTAPPNAYRSIAQAIDVEVYVRIHRDLRRHIATIFLEATD